MLTGGLGWEKGGAGIGLAGHQGCGWHGAGAGHRLITNHPFITREAGLGWEGESWEQNKLLSVCRGRRSIKRD